MKRKETENITYSEITTKRITSIPEKLIPSTTDNNMHGKIYASMLHAHFINAGDPGQYETELNKTLSENNLPTIKIPTIHDSKKILKTLMNIENLTERVTKENTQVEEKQKDKEHAEMTVQETETQMETLKGAEIGLQIHTSKSVGWPKSTLTLKQITKNLREGKYKFTYKYNRIKEEDIMKMITKNCIEITQDCFSIVDDGTFRKIRQGLIEEHTPPRGTDERKRRTSR